MTNATKLDRRHTGYGHFTYYVKPRVSYLEYNNKQTFHEWRDWCWETWGSSKEIDEWLRDIRTRTLAKSVSHNEHWVWQNDEHSCRIFLRTDAELALFLLKWK
jgi:hypothetical protein